MKIYRILTLITLVALSGCAVRQPYTVPGARPATKPVVVPRAEEKLEVVVIDPGHGGRALGAVGPTRLKEKDVVLDISKKLKKMLEREGYLVFLTRTGDYDVSLVRRRRIARNYEADLFISIHCDGSKNRKANGTAVYILSTRGARVVKDRALTKGDYLLSNESYDESRKTSYLDETIVDLKMDGSSRESRIFADLAVSELTKELGTKNLGVKSAAFAVLKNVDIPSVLVEVAFITNWWEEKLLKQDSVKQNVARALTQAILKYFEGI
jgi:N-acetylmuramoyl-L-alanine amidase